MSQVLRDISPEAEEWQLVRELSLLGLDEEVLERTFSTLSGGEQTRVLLSALFLDEGSWPMLDEPTDHLDEGGAGAACPISQPQPPGLPACLPRPGVSGPVRGPCAGPEPDGAGAGEGKFLRVVPGEAGPGPAGAGPEPAAEGGRSADWSRRPAGPLPGPTRWKRPNTPVKIPDCAPTGAMWATSRPR